MISAEIKYNLPSIGNFDLESVLKQIGEYKKSKLETDLASRFSEGRRPEAFSGVSTSQTSDTLTLGVEGLSAMFHTGGFLRGSPVTVIRRFNPSGTTLQGQRGAAFPKPFQTVQMSRYFFAKFYQTGDIKWRAMALAAHRDRGMTMKAHPFMVWTDEDEQYIKTVFEKFFTDNIKGN